MWLKLTLLISFIYSSSYAENIAVNDIDSSKKIVQLGVYKYLKKVKELVNGFEGNYDVYVHKINNYTIYIVNIENSIVPQELKKQFKGAFFIKKVFVKKNESESKKKKSKSTRYIELPEVKIRDYSRKINRSTLKKPYIKLLPLNKETLSTF